MTRARKLAPGTVLAAALAACGGSGGGSSRPIIPEQEFPTSPSEVVCRLGTASLSGKLVAPNGETGIAGATVTVSSAPGCTAKTSGTGAFTFRALPGADLTVSARRGPFVAEVTALPGTPVTLKIDPARVKLGYVAGWFAHAETMLAALGFAPVELPVAELPTADLTAYHAIFLNSGLDETFAAAAAPRLKAYVDGGGLLHASDYAFVYVEAAFPGAVRFVAPEPRVGVDGTLDATILDADLRDALGKQSAAIPLGLAMWTVVDSLGAGTEELVRASVRTDSGNDPTNKPLAARFASGAGKVTYASFHEYEEVETSAETKALLVGMIFGP